MVTAYQIESQHKRSLKDSAHAQKSVCKHPPVTRVLSLGCTEN
jgi:hypothetical protein